MLKMEYSFLGIQRILSLLNIFTTGPPASPATPAGPSHLDLFGASQPWNTSTLTWGAVTDQVRGGSSTAFLAPASEHLAVNAVLFSGHLDTSTLGGAGFASVTTKTVDVDASTHDQDKGESAEMTWDLSAYDGLQLTLGTSDAKRYALTLKDAVPSGKRNDSREKAGISWEAEFNCTEGVEEALILNGEEARHMRGERIIWLPWSKFKPTYRGREKDDAPPLQLRNIRRFGLMMRSFFDQQDGDFALQVTSIAARRWA